MSGIRPQADTAGQTLWILTLDGSQHADTIEYDTARSAWFAANGYRVLRLWNSRFLGDIEGAKEAIWAMLRNDNWVRP